MTNDICASIRARLKNIAKAEQTDFNAVLTRYGLERLLYRIGQSEYANQYLLKGALLFNLWYDMRHRPTKDIDLLGFGNNELDYLTGVFKEICLIPANDPTRVTIWNAFLRKNELEQKPLTEVITLIRNLIQAPFSSSNMDYKFVYYGL